MKQLKITGRVQAKYRVLMAMYKRIFKIPVPIVLKSIFMKCGQMGTRTTYTFNELNLGTKVPNIFSTVPGVPDEKL